MPRKSQKYLRKPLSPIVCPSLKDLSTNAQERIDQLCSAFEAECKVGPPPPLEQYLRDTPEPERSVLLRELLRLELYYHPRPAGGPDGYARRFPDHVALIRAVFQEAARAALEPTGPLPDTPSAQGDNGSASRHQWLVETIPGSDQSPPSEGDPVRLGNYELLKRLGVGGMGVVYMARDLSLKRI